MTAKKLRNNMALTFLRIVTNYETIYYVRVERALRDKMSKMAWGKTYLGVYWMFYLKLKIATVRIYFTGLQRSPRQAKHVGLLVYVMKLPFSQFVVQMA